MWNQMRIEAHVKLNVDRDTCEVLMISFANVCCCNLKFLYPHFKNDSYEAQCNSEIMVKQYGLQFAACALCRLRRIQSWALSGSSASRCSDSSEARSTTCSWHTPVVRFQRLRSPGTLKNISSSTCRLLTSNQQSTLVSVRIEALGSRVFPIQNNMITVWINVGKFHDFGHICCYIVTAEDEMLLQLLLKNYFCI